MAFVNRMAAILFLSIVIFDFCTGCGVNDVAVYKVRLNVLWSDVMFGEGSEERSHWSQVFGQTHNRSYALYHIGELPSPLLQDFSKSGDVIHLIEDGGGEPKVYDQFAADVNDGGMESMVFVDRGHSLISLLARLMKPPYWNIGVDSLDLCVDASWVDQVTLDLEPLEVKANEFRSSEPIKKVSHHNMDLSRFSFHHRKLRQLPPIAKIDVIKIKEYSTKELNDLARKELFTKLNKKSPNDAGESNNNHEDTVDDDTMYPKEQIRVKSDYEQLKDLEEEPVGTPRPKVAKQDVVVIRTSTALETPTKLDNNLKNMDDVVLAVANGQTLGLGEHLPRHFKSRLHHAVNRNQVRDCVVSAWSDWSPCSEPCGGITMRTRTILRKGHRCPPLLNQRMCEQCTKTGDADYEW